MTTPPPTGTIATGWRARLDPRPALRRMRDSGLAIVQIVVAATAAYVVAEQVLGHPAPLLAATVTVSSLGLVRDARPRRVLETVVGMLVGILVAEAFLLLAGQGWWQLALTLGLTLLVARLLSAQASFAIAAGIQALIVMTIPAVAPFTRLVDGLVGGVAALLATALIPRNPSRAALRDARGVFAALEQATSTLVQALRRGDRLRADRALARARAVQPLLDEWRSSLESGLAIARISPFLRGRRVELARLDRMREAVELASRNLRVVARRAVYLCDDGDPRPVGADVLAQVGRGLQALGASIDDISLAEQARAELLAVAGSLDPAVVLPGGSLGDQNLIAAMRPLTVDLLVATGMPESDARAAVPRI